MTMHDAHLFREIEKSGQSKIITDHGKPTLEIKKLRQRELYPLEVLKGTVVKYDFPTSPISDDDWENA